MLETVRRIREAISVRVTADMEAGYGSNEAELAETTFALIEAGAVGLNIQDGTVETLADSGDYGALSDATMSGDELAVFLRSEARH